MEPAAAGEPAIGAFGSDDAGRAADAEAIERRRLQVRLREEEAAQRAQAVGRCRRRRAERRAFLVTDVAVGLALHPGPAVALVEDAQRLRSEEHTSELQSLMRISYAVFCLKKKKNTISHIT